MRTRNNRIVFYLNDEELAALTDKVQKSKFPREKFIRITLANKRITEMPPVDYSHLVFEMRRAGQNLHRLHRLFQRRQAWRMGDPRRSVLPRRCVADHAERQCADRQGRDSRWRCHAGSAARTGAAAESGRRKRVKAPVFQQSINSAFAGNKP